MFNFFNSDPDESLLGRRRRRLNGWDDDDDPFSPDAFAGSPGTLSSTPFQPLPTPKSPGLNSTPPSSLSGRVSQNEYYTTLSRPFTRTQGSHGNSSLYSLGNTSAPIQPKSPYGIPFRDTPRGQYLLGLAVRGSLKKFAEPLETSTLGSSSPLSPLSHNPSPSSSMSPAAPPSQTSLGQYDPERNLFLPPLPEIPKPLAPQNPPSPPRPPEAQLDYPTHRPMALEGTLQYQKSSEKRPYHPQPTRPLPPPSVLCSMAMWRKKPLPRPSSRPSSSHKWITYHSKTVWPTKG